MNSKRYPVSIVWLRRDLRLRDNVALFKACEQSDRVCLAFVLHPPLLAGQHIGAPLVCVFFDAIGNLRFELRRKGSDLALLQGDFSEELTQLATRIGAHAVFYNEDYEPDAIRRDRRVQNKLSQRGIAVHSSLDHVYFGADEILRSDDSPYRMFTPYKRQWLDRRAIAPRQPLPSYDALQGRLLAARLVGETMPDPVPQRFGFEPSDLYPRAGERVALERLSIFLERGGAVERYRHDREFPALAGTSQLSPQLRAGTIGIRTCAEAAFARRDNCAGEARSAIETWIFELIWRDFYQMILARFPHVVSNPFEPAAERIAWRSPGHDLTAWCAGRTGYPIIDAAMRQLNTFGWMHNRLRMLVASFLTKDLLIDWRMGERYFERHLADADLAANNGGWQWVASTGTDSTPYFRIFNPVTQSRRFDPDGTFIKQMLPELAQLPSSAVHEPWKMPPVLQSSFGIEIGTTYPAPIVDHAKARIRALEAFKSIGPRGA